MIVQDLVKMSIKESKKIKELEETIKTLNMCHEIDLRRIKDLEAKNENTKRIHNTKN